MSPSPTRLVATLLLAALGVLLAAFPALAASPGDTWLPVAAPPDRPDLPVFALAVSPSDGRQLLAGTGGGSIFRSADGGASWQLVKGGLGRGVLTLAFDPFRPGTVLAGTRGAGVWSSADTGLTWQQQPGTEARTVRTFAFARGLALAGADQGVLALRDSGPWAAVGLSQVRVSALTLAGGGEPPRLLAGGDASQGSEALPLFASPDGGRTWTTVAGAIGGSTMAAALAVGPAAADGSLPVLLGTNAGLFLSADGGQSWQQLTGGGALPATDFTAAAYAGRPERFYVASDGGGFDAGGLWASDDGGGTFRSLASPVRVVTALAVSRDETPTLYVATFRSVDHAVMLWSYRDAGGSPHQPASGVPAAVPPPLPDHAGQTRVAPPSARGAAASLLALAGGPEAPYLAVGAVALVVVVVALGAYMRRGRRL